MVVLNNDVDMIDCDDTSGMHPNPLADFMSPDIVTKPFNVVSGSATKSSFNPFRKKCGLLNVLTRQSTKTRIVAKDGQINTVNENVSTKFCKDIYTTMIDMNWTGTLMMFVIIFYSSCSIFAATYYAIFWQHGDFLPENQPGPHANITEFRKCAKGIINFASCFLFSVEIQTTIGFGGRTTTEECPFAIITFCFQCIFGMIISLCLLGIVMAKFTVPRRRGETIVFSKNAAISLRNGALYFSCRISDKRRSRLLDAHVRMLFLKKVVTEEGEEIPYHMTHLKCGSELDGTNDRVDIFWPTELSHRIDKNSPLYEVYPQHLPNSQFEIIVMLEGVAEETGNAIQVRTSYLPNEINWGHRFDQNVVSYDGKLACYVVHHGIINKSEMDNTPRASAKQIELTLRKQKSIQSETSSNTYKTTGAASRMASNSSEESPERTDSSVLTTPGGSGSGSFYETDEVARNKV